MTSSLSWPRLRMRCSSACARGRQDEHADRVGHLARAPGARPASRSPAARPCPAASCGSTDCRAVPFQSPCTSACSKKSPAAIMRSNSARRRSGSARAWRSPGRGAREVNEIDSAMLGSRASTALTMLDLPAPEGAATMKRVPRMAGRSVIRCSGPARASARSAPSAPPPPAWCARRPTWSPACSPRD